MSERSISVILSAAENLIDRHARCFGQRGFLWMPGGNNQPRSGATLSGHSTST